MRALVIGAAGMLGHDLRATVPEGVQCVGLDLPELDITDPHSLDRALLRQRPEVVIQAAAYTDVDGCESHEQQALAVNGAGAGLVARACAERDVPLLHLSTDYVFDGTIPAPGRYAEQDAVGPLSAYGRTKLAGERAVVDAGGTAWILRTQWLYGRHGRNFVETMLRLAAERDELSVVDDQVGCPTATHDLAALLWGLAVARPPTGVYHAAHAGECSWHAFAAEIFRQAGLRVTLRRMDSGQLDRPAPRPARAVLDCTRLKETLRLCLPPWQEGLERYLHERTRQEVDA